MRNSYRLRWGEANKKNLIKKLSSASSKRAKCASLCSERLKCRTSERGLVRMRRKLTERNIPGLKAHDAAIDIMHQMTPAAGLRITVGGAKIWFYVYRSPVLRNDQGEAKQRRASLGYHPSGRVPARQPQGRVLAAMNVKEFEQAYVAFRALLAKGIDPQPLAVARPTAKRRKSTA